MQAIKAGANDFLTKPVASNVILEAIERGLAHHKFTRGLRSERDIVQARLAALTPREREVFELVIRGNTNKQIGRALSCTERTVKAHRHKVMEKMQIQSVAEQIQSVAELVSLAERAGIGASTRTSTSVQSLVEPPECSPWRDL